MLKLFTLLLNRIHCDLLFENFGFGDYDRGCERRDLCRRIKYEDILFKNEGHCDDVVKTIFGYIPATESSISLRSTDEHYDSFYGDHNNVASAVLKTAFHNLKKQHPCIEELALEVILNFFYEWIKKCTEKRCGPCPRFELCCEYYLKTCPKKIICDLINCRGKRNIFKVFLLALRRELLRISKAHSFKKSCEDLRVVYAAYLHIVVEDLLKKIEVAEDFVGGNNNDEYFTNFYTFIPSNITTNNLANPIIDVNTWINVDAAKQ